MTDPTHGILRPAVAGDAAAIASLEASVFAGEAWSEEQVREELTGYGRRGWVATSTAVEESSSSVEDRSPGGDGAEGPLLHARSVSGYVIMRTVGDVSDLQRIAVDPARQRAGLAGRLLAAASAGVRGEGAERILLEVAEDNAAARAFYARHGFVEIDRRPRYYRSGADALVLARDLGAGQGR